MVVVGGCMISICFVCDEGMKMDYREQGTCLRGDKSFANNWKRFMTNNNVLVLLMIGEEEKTTYSAV